MQRPLYPYACLMPGSAYEFGLITPDIPPSKQSKPRTDRSRLSGTYIRPTLFNPPMPRLKPQPIKTSMMIHKRVLARENQRVQQALHLQNIKDMSQELRFWKSLGIPVGTMQEQREWCKSSQFEIRHEIYVDRPCRPQLCIIRNTSMPRGSASTGLQNDPPHNSNPKSSNALKRLGNARHSRCKGQRLRGKLKQPQMALPSKM